MEIWQSFSRKQRDVFNFWCNDGNKKKYDAIICDGAVRSGKTTAMTISFICWAFNEFNGGNFAICGKTISSLKRNVLDVLLPTVVDLKFKVDYRASKNMLILRYGRKVNRFYIFGGKDESSAALIQGITLCGVMLDEVALMPRSFVEQALARCSTEGSKFWFNCNPDNPQHWFYKEWIKKCETKRALYLHFTMNDNPSLSAGIKKRYENLYSGVFYKRFIRGEWVAGTGLIYPMFSEDLHIEKNLPVCEKYYVSVDYGTVNPASFGLWGLAGGVYYRLGEYYHDSKIAGFQKTDEEYYEDLKNLCGNLKIEAVVVDPSAASFMAVIRRGGRYKAMPANNDVLFGLRKVSSALKAKKIMFSPSCKDSIREFKSYSWSEKGADVPKKENDHAMDDIRYFTATILDNESVDDDFFAVSIAR